LNEFEFNLCSSDKLTGENDQQPDQASLSLPVEIKDESYNWAAVAVVSTVTIGAIVGVVFIVLIILAVVAALIALAIKKRRAEEHERKDEMKKEADKADGEISFRMEEADTEGDMEDSESARAGWKAERDRLKAENIELAAAVDESPLDLEDTDDPELLVGQIKTLKNENDRLSEIANSRSKQRRKKKKKAEGFGQQQD